MNSEIKSILISLGITLAGAAVAASGIHSSNKARESFMETPQITSQAELEKALAGEKQRYCMINMPVSGAEAEDPFGILTGEYIYIYYSKEVCKAEKGKNGETEYIWEYSNSSSNEVAYGSDMVIFDTYPVESLDYVAVVEPSVLSADQVKAEYIEKTNGSYYPNGTGDKSGNIRYTLAVLPMEQEVAMYATVGDGEIIMEYNDDAMCYVVSEGTMENLAEYYESDAGMMRILLGMMIITPMGVMMLVTMVAFAIGSAVSRRKKDKTGKRTVKK